MGKRFVDTTIWTQNKWFRKMEPRYKLLWYYLISNCDPVGVWEEDMELAAFIIGETYDKDDTLEAFRGQVRPINGGKKWWIVGFCSFQYGELLESHTNNRPHQSYIALLKKHRLWIDYTKGLDSPKEKDKEKEQETDSPEDDFGFDVFWNLYDHKTDPNRCRRYWMGKTSIKDGTRINDAVRAEIMQAVPAYICSTPDKQYRKNPATYLYNSAWKDEIIERRSGNSSPKRLANDEQNVQWPEGEVFDVSNVP